MSIFPGRHDQRLDGASGIGGRRRLRRAPRGEEEEKLGECRGLTPDSFVHREMAYRLHSLAAVETRSVTVPWSPRSPEASC